MFGPLRRGSRLGVQHAVDAVFQLESPRRGLKMDVAGAPTASGGEDLVDHFGGVPRIAWIEPLEQVLPVTMDWLLHFAALFGASRHVHREGADRSAGSAREGCGPPFFPYVNIITVHAGGRKGFQVESRVVAR